MKPETKQWLDKLTPLLVHLKEGRKILNKQDTTKLSIFGTNLDQLLANPDLYQIHIEPRVVYLIQNDDGTLHHGASCSDPAQFPMFPQCMVRFIEDLDWKPGQQGNPDHTPPHLKPT